MRKTLFRAVTVLAALLGLTLAHPLPTAHADLGDAQYLECLYRGWGHPSTNMVGSLNWGHRIVSAIAGGMSPLDERDFVYTHSDVDTLAKANVMVNCATSVYLGFGPPVS